jgi:hypothetical protein
MAIPGANSATATIEPLSRARLVDIVHRRNGRRSTGRCIVIPAQAPPFHLLQGECCNSCSAPVQSMQFPEAALHSTLAAVKRFAEGALHEIAGAAIPRIPIRGSFRHSALRALRRCSASPCRMRPRWRPSEIWRRLRHSAARFRTWKGTACRSTRSSPTAGPASCAPAGPRRTIASSPFPTASAPAIAVEVWAMPLGELGGFLAAIPLGLGPLTLEDGIQVTGFLCEEIATREARGHHRSRRLAPASRGLREPIAAAAVRRH